VNPRVIAAADVFPIRIPLVKSFSFSSGTAGAAGETAPHVFVRVTDSQGESGWGEARPIPSWSYETLESVTTTLRGYLAPAVIGLPITDRWELHRRMFRTVGRGPSPGQPIAKAALDMAVHDLCARAAGLPLRAYLGGSTEPRSVDLSYTVTAHDPESAADDVAEGRAQGYRHFNFKAAMGGGPSQDAEVAGAIRRTAGPGAFVWADANQGYRLHEARAAAEAFKAVGVNVLEQPLPADQLPLMAQLRAATTLPLAVDESTVGPTDFLAYVREGVVDYLVIKVARNGGLWPTLGQIAIAEAAGLPLLVSGLTESLLSKIAACHVASAFGFTGPAALNGSQFLDESALYPDKESVESQGTVHLPVAPGIGIRPNEAALRDLATKRY
jgi:L-alanine-DL-glutamate epimerase-like enolase superfamily enzyme